MLLDGEVHGQGSSRHAEHCPSWKTAGELGLCVCVSQRLLQHIELGNYCTMMQKEGGASAQAAGGVQDFP